MDRAGGEVERGARPLDGDTMVLWGGIALSVLLSIWLTWGIWGAGMAGGDDTAAHVVRADFALEHFFRAGRLDGWQSSFGLGYQQFLFIGPGFSILVAAIELLSFGTLSTLDATKTATVVSFALVPLSLAFVAWAFGLGKRATGVAAILGLAVASTYGGAGLAAIFGSGLLPNHLGSALLLVSFGGLVLIVRRPSVRRIVFTAAAATALVATHPIAAIILAFLATALVLAAGAEWLTTNASAISAHVRPWLDRVAPAPGAPALAGRSSIDAPVPPALDPRGEPASGSHRWLRHLARGPVTRLVGLGAAGLLAIGMAGFVLVPLLAHGDLRGENSAWSDVPLVTRLLGIWRGEFLYRPWVALLVVVGVAFALLLALAHRRGALTLVLTPVCYLVLARAFIAITPDNIVAIQLTNRSIATIGLLALLPLAALIAAPHRFAWRLARVTGSHPSPAATGIVVGNAAVPLVLALLVVLAPSGLDRDRATTVTPTAPLQAMADQLRAVVPEGARFATQRIPARERQLTGMSHPDLWLAWATGANTLNIYNLESSIVFEPVYEAEHLPERPAEEVAARLSRLGVSHLAALDVAEIRDIDSSPWFRPVWRDSSMAVYEVVPPPGQPRPQDLASAPVPIAATLTAADPQRLVIETDASTATTATVAVGWSPKWRATVDGESVPTVRTADNLLAVNVPAGRATVTLDFAIDRADVIGRTLTALSLAAAIAALVHDRRRRRTGADDPV